MITINKLTINSLQLTLRLRSRFDSARRAGQAVNNKKKKSIVNCQLLTVRERGFTFIELLAVIAVLIAIGVIVGTILFTSLRGTNKTNTITIVRQNGNYALSLMSKMIREARSFDGVSTAENGPYTVNCLQSTPVPPSPTPTPISYKFLKITSFDDRQTTFACCSKVLPTPSFIASSSASPACTLSLANTPLIDTGVVSFNASTCSFTCTQASSSNVPAIQIHFELGSYNANPTVLPEKTVGPNPIPFDTSVTFRNLVR